MGSRALELLAPAKNMELGQAAVNHGADAVYIGARRFGARAAVGNSLEDIEGLCAYAHKFNARVYVALNTLLFDGELAEAEQLIHGVWNAGADALIIQDMGILEMDLPPIPLFASTQVDNRTVDKVRFLEQSGFQRVILARELGLDAIKEIRESTQVDLETFVHGALCVCYSGQCYMSATIGGRSANRGACGQPCRLPWTLKTDEGRVLEENRYLLSLKDMNRADHLDALAEAGISSFKIEGRLKDLAYVKNVTGFYRRRLDALLDGNPSYVKASSGRTRFFFTPDPAKTFNRGQTEYFLGRARTRIHSFDTPKSLGEKIGRVKTASQDGISLDVSHDLHNGDGLCFMDANHRLTGFYVNRVGADGRLLLPPKHPLRKSLVPKGSLIYRNHDQEFSNTMAGNTAERRIGIHLVFSEAPSGFTLAAEDEDGIGARAVLETPKEPAKNPDRAMEVIEKQLGKLGNTMFYLSQLDIRSNPWFLSAKDLNRLRREVVEALEIERSKAYRSIPVFPRPEPVPFYQKELDFRANAANRLARMFYERRGVNSLAPAYELDRPGPDGPIMTTKHCIRYSLGQCSGQNKESAKPFPPLYLENRKGRFRLVFNCQSCEMEIWKYKISDDGGGGMG